MDMWEMFGIDSHFHTFVIVILLTVCRWNLRTVSYVIVSLLVYSACSNDFTLYN